MKEVTGDLVAMAESGLFDVIAHGCNIFCTMGKGIAKQIREVFPEAYSADRRTTPGEYNKLGTVTYAEIRTHGLVVVNAYTQPEFWRVGQPRGQVFVDYDAVRMCFRKIKRNWGGTGRRFGIPLIGAGLAGGDWSIISKIIESEMAGEDLTLVHFGG